MSVLRDLFFPPRCSGCGALLRFEGFGTARQALCAECAAKWEDAKATSCGICGARVDECRCMPEELQRARCGTLRKLTFYQGGSRDAIQNLLIYRLKNRPERQAAEFVAKELEKLLNDLMAEFSLTPENTRLTYIPRGRRAALESGTDQAKVLCRELSLRSGIACVVGIRRRAWHGKPQKKLNRTERKKNAIESFRIAQNADVYAKNVILLDDIVTSGASMAVCARLLRRAGAERIFCLSVAVDAVHREADAGAHSWKSTDERAFFGKNH